MMNPEPVLLGFEDPKLFLAKNTALAVSAANESLADVSYIYLMPTKLDGEEKKFQHCAGVELAKRQIEENRNRKIALVGIISKEQAIKISSDVEDILDQKNVVYIDCLADSPSELAMKAVSDFEEQSLDKQFNLVQKNNQRVVLRFLHDIKYVTDIENPQSEQQGKVLREVMRAAKTQFPALRSKTNAEILEFMKSVKIELPEVMKDEEIEGVYCDIEGTLLVENEINKTVLDTLDGFRQEGKQVTLWTMGQTETLRKTLEEKGIVYPVRSKLEFTGAIAEIVIDDDDRNTFIATTRIQPKQFIEASVYKS